MSKPKAFISVNKNRRKQHENLKLDDVPSLLDHSVFLRDDQEFEVELENPTSEVHLAKIKKDGKFISNSGIVLRPGEHVFLERFIDESRKFKFETYNVPEENSDVVQNNGVIEVRFYEERSVNTDYHDIIVDDNDENPWEYTTPTRYTPSTPTWDNFGGDNITFSTSGGKRSLSVENDTDLETGRVEKGDRSSQNFKNVEKSFSSYPSSKTRIKILPKSRKPVTKEEIRVYCTNCGAKFKNNWKFCAHCGTERP